MELFSARVQTQTIDPNALTFGFGALDDCGAVVTFSGLVRGEQGSLAALELEHYPAMTEKALDAIIADARVRWPLLAARVVHRVGRMEVGETIVMVATASSHRADAFEAASFLMDYLKTKAPFWKRAHSADGHTDWVDAKDSDDAAASRWDR